MRSGLNIILIILTVFMMAGCTSTVKYKSVGLSDEITPDMATIRVHRSGSWAGGAVAVKVSDEHRDIGQLGPGGEFVWGHQPGHMAIVLSTITINRHVPTSAIIIPVEAGKTYSFITDMQYGGRTRLLPDNPEKVNIIYESFADSLDNGISDDWQLKLAEMTSQ